MRVRGVDPSWRQFAVTVMIIVLAAAAGISYFHGSAAIDKANAVATKARVAAVDAKAAAADANRAVNCLNNVLADRNGPGKRDNEAQAAFANEARRWVRSLNLLFTVKPKTPQASAAVKAFKDESVSFQTVITALARTLAADQKIRDQNALGKC